MSAAHDLVVGSEFAGKVHVWRLSSGEHVHTLHPSDYGIKDMILTGET